MNAIRRPPAFSASGWALLAVLSLGCFGSLAAAEPRLLVEKLPTGVILIVDNPTVSDIAVTVTPKFTNVTADVSLPATLNIPPGKRLPVVKLLRADANRAWSYNYTWKWSFGRLNAEHDDRFFYRLPFPSGKEWRVMQAFNGAFSHNKPPAQFAVDWEMPEGSQVCAARAGLVVEVKSDSNEGGADYAAFNEKANYVRVLHSDGTIGLYLHLKQNGALVKPGQRVAEGDPIGLSGNTGFSSKPHLHFATQRAIDGNTRVAVPIQFRGPDGKGMIPTKGQLNSVP